MGNRGSMSPSSVAEDSNLVTAEIIESDVELEGDVVEPDNDPPQTMGDPSVEVTEENRDAAQSAKVGAMQALSEGRLEEDTDNLTKAILELIAVVVIDLQLQ